MLKKLRFGLCLLGFMQMASTAQAQEEFIPKICDESELVACGSRLNEVACLEMFHACGRYENIIRYFDSESVKTPDATFYTGLSYYGLYNRSRIKSQQCEFSDAAQRLLGGFLAEARASNQLRNQTVFRRTYWATRAIEDLKRNQSCNVSGGSDASLIAYGSQYAESLIRKLFIMKVESDTALGQKINEVKNSIQSAVRGIASKAAEIEANLKLRRQALDASNTVIQDMINVYNSFFGRASIESKTDRDYASEIDLNLEANGTFLQAKERSADYLEQAKAAESMINTKLGAVSADAYARSKIALATRAEDEISLGTGTKNASNDVFNGESGKQFTALVELTNAAQANDKSLEILKKLQTQWPVTVACATRQSQWQCANAEGN